MTNILTNKLKVAMSQFNPVVGDIVNNGNRLLQEIKLAVINEADLFIMPELALCGYLPEDLLLRKQFHDAIILFIDNLLQNIEFFNIMVLLTCPLICNKDNNFYNCHNSVLLIHNGKIIDQYNKVMLPNYGPFNEKRYFVSGINDPIVFELKDLKVGLLICEDLWSGGSKLQNALKLKDPDILCVMNASPYEFNKYNDRFAVARDFIHDLQIPIVYLNIIGGQDDLIFDGASFVLDKSGNLLWQLPSFVECLAYFVVQKDKDHVDILKENFNLTQISSKISIYKNPNNIPYYPFNQEVSVYNALCLSLADYVNKNKFKGIVLGLSGGIDSALALTIAVDALGAESVFCVMMPSKFTSSMSLEDAKELTDKLGVRYEVIPIDNMVNTSYGAVSGLLNNLLQKDNSDNSYNSLANYIDKVVDVATSSTVLGVTQENIQARVRNMILMAVSNTLGYLVLTTSNKSELSVGYATLYGDLSGGFALLKDVYKTIVYKLAKYRNSISIESGNNILIPERIITRPPSAELRDNQTDADSLPEYEILDKIIELLIAQRLSVDDIVLLGYDIEDVSLLAKLLKTSEYKRHQAPIGPKITNTAFSVDWRYPVTNNFQL